MKKKQATPKEETKKISEKQEPAVTVTNQTVLSTKKK
jgi:hypothetical protein